MCRVVELISFQPVCPGEFLGDTIGLLCCNIQLWFNAGYWYFSVCLELRKLNHWHLNSRYGFLFRPEPDRMFTMVLLVYTVRQKNLSSNINRESGINISFSQGCLCVSVSVFMVWWFYFSLGHDFFVVHLLWDSHLLWLSVLILDF